ncbi:MAG: hypothetical protein CBD21_05070 [bacterium TMED161]|nr:MAG: hypothetical protein CBD21_05070 [bacterium TMED161]
MFRLKAKKDETKVILNATCLLLKVAEADQTITTDEIKITKEIISDFFDVDSDKIDLVIKNAKEANQVSTDLFESGSVLNDYFSIQDKIDFILSIYEVAYIDNNFDFLERHVITQILNIFNLDKNKIKKINKQFGNKLL